MKKTSILKKTIAVTLTMAMFFSVGPTGNTKAAKKPALNKTNASVNVGGTIKLKVKNGAKKAKVTWTSSNKKKANITKSVSNGNKAYATIKGIAAGKTIIFRYQHSRHCAGLSAQQQQLTGSAQPAGSAAAA